MQDLLVVGEALIHDIGEAPLSKVCAVAETWQMVEVYRPSKETDQG